MKKVLVISMLMLFAFGTYAEARNVYDYTGRTILQDNTLRGRKRAAQAQELQAKRVQAAAAARIKYYEAMKNLETQNVKTDSQLEKMIEQDYNNNF